MIFARTSAMEIQYDRESDMLYIGLLKHTERAINDFGSREEFLVSDLHDIGLRCATLLRPGPSAADHGDLLYDERGLTNPGIVRKSNIENRNGSDSDGTV